MRSHHAIAVLAAIIAAPTVTKAQERNLWLSQGYGYLFDAGPDTLRAFEVTGISCLPSFTATAGSPPAGAAAAYRFTRAPVTILLLADSTGGMRFHMNCSASDGVRRRVWRKPPGRDRPTPNTPTSHLH